MMVYQGRISEHPVWQIHSRWFPHYLYPAVDVKPDMTALAMRIGRKFVAPDSVSFHLYLKNNSPESHGESLYYRVYLLLHPEECNSPQDEKTDL